MKEIVEDRGQNCYTPTSGMCFSKCINNFIKKEDTEEFKDLTRYEKYRSEVMTSARVQPLCRKYNVNIGCSNGKGISP